MVRHKTATDQNYPYPNGIATIYYIKQKIEYSGCGKVE